MSDLLSRITTDPAIFGGKPIVGGRLLAVEHLLEMLGAGTSEAQILAGDPWLKPEDLRACLQYAAACVRVIGHQISLAWTLAADYADSPPDPAVVIDPTSTPEERSSMVMRICTAPPPAPSGQGVSP